MTLRTKRWQDDPRNWPPSEYSAAVAHSMGKMWEIAGDRPALVPLPPASSLHGQPVATGPDLPVGVVPGWSACGALAVPLSALYGDDPRRESYKAKRRAAVEGDE
ncbi:hypothetical protein HN371_29435 [Candidatus Poribacteria bacterium]|jgi:hypothetical protein|nr:hypothetical protein [Candidatus Poribacteria bacterium]MBT7096600.1 hypothetical protein [Candidatus Poribacteria bacterium]